VPDEQWLCSKLSVESSAMRLMPGCCLHRLRIVGEYVVVKKIVSRGGIGHATVGFGGKGLALY
jgi:hypothetical protein